jgi:translation initiation factor eIF-2B subunit delta
MGEVTKVFLPSTYMLANGALVAPMGSSLISCVASKFRVPVVGVCETYKFDDRVNLDQVNNNQQGNKDSFLNNYLLQWNPNKYMLKDIMEKKEGANVEIVNLLYDLTLQKYLSMIVTELGNIPPHSVPVVIREICSELEDKKEKEDDSSDEGSIENNSSSSSEEDFFL